MRIKKPQLSEKRRLRRSLKRIRCQARQDYLKDWHPHFVILRWFKQEQTWVLFETVERKLLWGFTVRPYWLWDYCVYRLPEVPNEK